MRRVRARRYIIHGRIHSRIPCNPTCRYATRLFGSSSILDIVRRRNDRGVSSRSRRTRTTLADTFLPSRVEKGRYDWWERSGYFSVKGKKSRKCTEDSVELTPPERFSMILPPPNVTGSLHIGHALTVAVQDSLVRWQRMQGKEVSWVPGLDHAGIATQTVVEKFVQKTQNRTRHEMGRDAFVEEVWKWKRRFGGRINTQIRGLGASLDWENEFFTLDEARSEAVVEAFVRMYDDNLIYRGERIVHWCPHLSTVISDIEVEYEDLSEPRTIRVPSSSPSSSRDVTFGQIDHFLYPVEGATNGEALEVATTRLETMLGDVAVAVHPDDSRWSRFIGQHVAHPFFENRKLPVVADATLVDMETGTGVVKLTPAHDPMDFEAAKRHGLDVRPILNFDGTLRAEAGERYAGRDRFDVREQLATDLESRGLFRGSRSHPMRLARCSRSGDVLEPMLLPQWFVRTEDLACEASKQARDGELEITPELCDEHWARWLNSPQDWCVSRQLWWGHRIPAYRVLLRDVANENDEETFVVGRNENEARERACTKFGLAPGEFALEQDSDVLDTWFSSALLPLSAYGWPRNSNPSMYPLDVMESGSDILFFWLARMAMLCTHLHGRDTTRRPDGDGAAPAAFRRAFLHPIVRDRQGRKMSKSLGNVIDPLYLIRGASLSEMTKAIETSNLPTSELARALREVKAEYPEGIEECGTDALRLALLGYMQQSERIHLDVQRVVHCRHFCNKLWQAGRFMQRSASVDVRDVRTIESLDSVSDVGDPLLRRWLLSRFAHVSHEVNDALEGFEFARATNSVQNFVTRELCGVFIEWAKPSLCDSDDESHVAGSGKIASETMHTVFEASLRLLHPFAPFVTEDLWQHQRRGLRDDENEDDDRSRRTIMLADWPNANDLQRFRDSHAERDMNMLLDALHGVRSLKKRVSEMGLRHDESIESISICPEQERGIDILNKYLEPLREQSKTKTLTVDGFDFLADGRARSIVHSVPGSFRIDLALTSDVYTRKRIEEALKTADKKGKRLTKKLEKARSIAERSEQNADRVPEHVRASHAADVLRAEKAVAALEDTLSTLRNILDSE